MENKIVKWLALKLRESKCRGFVIGVSGGIDSAVAAALSFKASKKTLALIMPCESEANDLQDALKLVKKFKIPYKIIRLEKPYFAIKKLLPVKLSRVAAGNLKARLRMLILYSFANSGNALVVGCGNKTELKFGYFTKYGDGAADILPLGNLVKSEVRKAAQKLGIPSSIIKKPPSAGLWKGQTDEKEIGLSYDILDGILKNISSIKKLDRTGRKKAETLLIRGAHKMRLPEICK